MRRILFALLLLAIAAPAAAQDWERVFTEGAPEPAFKVLMLDPSEPRESRDRYKLAPLGRSGSPRGGRVAHRAPAAADAFGARVEPAAVHGSANRIRPGLRGGRILRWRAGGGALA